MISWEVEELPVVTTQLTFTCSNSTIKTLETCKIRLELKTKTPERQISLATIHL